MEFRIKKNKHEYMYESDRRKQPQYMAHYCRCPHKPELDYYQQTAKKLHLPRYLHHTSAYCYFTKAPYYRPSIQEGLHGVNLTLHSSTTGQSQVRRKTLIHTPLHLVERTPLLYGTLSLVLTGDTDAKMGQLSSF
jgi:hypothetical protein